MTKLDKRVRQIVLESITRFPDQWAWDIHHGELKCKALSLRIDFDNELSYSWVRISQGSLSRAYNKNHGASLFGCFSPWLKKVVTFAKEKKGPFVKKFEADLEERWTNMQRHG